MLLTLQISYVYPLFWYCCKTCLRLVPFKKFLEVYQTKVTLHSFLLMRTWTCSHVYGWINFLEVLSCKSMFTMHMQSIYMIQFRFDCYWLCLVFMLWKMTFPLLIMTSIWTCWLLNSPSNVFESPIEIKVFCGNEEQCSACCWWTIDVLHSIVQEYFQQLIIIVTWFWGTFYLDRAQIIFLHVLTFWIFSFQLQFPYPVRLKHTRILLANVYMKCTAVCAVFGLYWYHGS